MASVATPAPGITMQCPAVSPRTARAMTYREQGGFIGVDWRLGIG
jgi:hypothetical protein